MSGPNGRNGSGGSAPGRATPGHVIFVLSGLTMGGAEAQLATILEADRERLRTTRAQILTMTPERNPYVVRRMEDLGLEIHTIDRTAMSFPAFLLALVRFFRRQRPDVVHTFLAGSMSTWGRLAATLAGVPHVLYSDLSLDPVRTRAQRTLDPLLHRRTSRFLPNATAIADRLAREGAPRERIRVVRNGVDLQRFDPGGVVSSRPEWDLPEDAVVAGFLGMFRPVKRPELFVQAVLELPPEQRPDALVMAGDGPLMPRLREMRDADPWLRERLRLVGVLEDTPAFLQGIDFLVLTSDTEGLPNAILEAMAMGRPCIATRVSDVPELLGDAGEIVDTGDVRGLAAAIARMTARSDEERAAMGRAGRAKAQAEFGLQAAADRFWDAHVGFDGGRARPGTGAVDVALFLPSLRGGGAERVMLELARSFAEEGRTVEVVVASQEGPYVGEMPEGVRLVDLGSGRAALSLVPLVRYLRRTRPRALLSTLEHTNVVAILAGRMAPGVRVVVREANTATEDMAQGSLRSRMLVRAMRTLYPRADAVVAPSKGVVRALRDHLKVPQERIVRIANPTVTPRVLAGRGTRPDHPWFADDQPPVVLGVGRLSEQKDFGTLIRAFASVRQQAECRLVILGEGEQREALARLASELGVRDDLDLPGFVDDPFPYMASARVFVLSSRWEGLPNVLIQAMALGTPVVATDCPSGPADITDDGTLGRLVPVEDPSAMARAILEALREDPHPPPDTWMERYRPGAVARRYLAALGLAEENTPARGSDGG